MWNPSENALQRLILFCDVVAIAFHRFRQKSFGLPHAEYDHDRKLWLCHPLYLAKRDELLKEYDEIRAAASDNGYITRSRYVESLYYEVIAQLNQEAACDPRSEEAVASAAQWLSYVCTPWHCSQANPWTHCVPVSLNEGGRGALEEFNRQMVYLTEYQKNRATLRQVLSKLKEKLPREIDLLFNHTVCSWSGGSEPISQEQLFKLILSAKPNERPAINNPCCSAEIESDEDTPVAANRLSAKPGKKKTGKRKRGRRVRTEDDQLVKQENDLYRDWEHSGLTQPEFIRKRGLKEREGKLILDRARKRLNPKSSPRKSD